MIHVMEMVILFITGLAVGSFASASAWRLHKQENAKTEKAKNKYSITKGRSMCEHCGHQLAAKDLVPLFSWLSLKGRCRYCHKKLSIEYVGVELITGILFALSYQAWEFDSGFGYFSFFVWLVMLSLLVILAIYDLKWLLLPNRLVYPLIILAIVFVSTAALFDGGPELIRDSVYGLLVIGGTFYLLYQVSGGKWIGGGDVKLAIYIGLYLGLARSILTFALAFNIAAIVIIPLMVLKKVDRKSKIPFGPFLIVATIIASLWGYQIVEWYNDTFLYGLI